MGVIFASAPSGTGSLQIVTQTPGQKLFLRGWAAQEDTGTAPAKLQLLDSPGGNQLVPITLAANESVREFVPVESEAGEGIYVATGGLWLSRLVGTTTVTVYYALEQR